MAHQIRLDFDGVSADTYWAVNDALGMDIGDQATWPPGLVSHAAGTTDDGGLAVTEVWDTREDQAAFMDSQLGAALGQVQVPPPARVTWCDLVANEQR